MIKYDLSFELKKKSKDSGKDNDLWSMLAVGGGNALCQIAIRCLTKQEEEVNYLAYFLLYE